MGGSPSEFKFAMAERDFALTFQRYAANEALGTPAFTGVDLWRFDADGKVTEHWDVLEPTFVSPSGRDLFAHGA